MFFILSKILSFLIDPFFWVLFLFILALIARKVYKRKRYFITGLIVLLFFSNGFVYKLAEDRWSVNSTDLKDNYEYGILLGGMISLSSTENQIIFNTSNDRLLNCLELYNSKKINKILITGASGSLNSDMIEATILKGFLINIGVPSKDILTEDKSKNTYENALFCNKIVQEHHKGSSPNCLIITSNYHMRRSLQCFYQTKLRVDPYIKRAEKSHFDLEGIVVPQSHILFKWKVLLHEIVGYFTYRIMGYI